MNRRKENRNRKDMKTKRENEKEKDNICKEKKVIFFFSEKNQDQPKNDELELIELPTL